MIGASLWLIVVLFCLFVTVIDAVVVIVDVVASYSDTNPFSLLLFPLCFTRRYLYILFCRSRSPFRLFASLFVARFDADDRRRRPSTAPNSTFFFRFPSVCALPCTVLCGLLCCSVYLSVSFCFCRLIAACPRVFHSSTLAAPPHLRCSPLLHPLRLCSPTAAAPASRPASFGVIVVSAAACDHGLLHWFDFLPGRNFSPRDGFLLIDRDGFYLLAGMKFLSPGRILLIGRDAISPPGMQFLPPGWNLLIGRDTISLPGRTFEIIR